MDFKHQKSFIHPPKPPSARQRHTSSTLDGTMVCLYGEAPTTLIRLPIDYAIMTDWLPIGSLIISIICLMITVFLWNKVKTETFGILENLDTQLKKGLEDVGSQLEPILTANSRAMGAISSLSDDTKMDKALERRIGQDLLGQNEDIFEMVKMAFPRVAEYVEDRPEALSKLLPRLNTLISDPEARKRLNLDISGASKTDISRIWQSDR